MSSKAYRVSRSQFYFSTISIIAENSLLVSSYILSLIKRPGHGLFIFCSPSLPPEWLISERRPCCKDVYVLCHLSSISYCCVAIFKLLWQLARKVRRHEKTIHEGLKLTWLKKVFSTSTCILTGRFKNTLLLNHWWTSCYHLRNTIGCHSSSMTCWKQP